MSSYKAQAILANNDQLLMRVAACAANHAVAGPVNWAYEHQWKLSAQSGWAEAYAAAIAASVPQPGNSETVITDSMILSAVESILAEEAA